MHTIPLLASICVCAVVPAQAQELADVCHASSSYDLTVTTGALVFDRAVPAPRRIELREGRLVVDGAATAANAEQRDRLALFEQELRALVPDVKRVARNGVDLAAAAVRDESVRLRLGAETRSELARQVAAHAADLKRRIDASTSTHDWQGDAFDRYANDIVAGVAPLVAADLGQQAVTAAVGGDLDAAASLRDRAAGLTGGGLQRDLQGRLQASLRPQVQALCPSIRRLAELQRDVRGADGRSLDLLEIEAGAKPAASARRGRRP